MYHYIYNIMQFLKTKEEKLPPPPQPIALENQVIYVSMLDRCRVVAQLHRMQKVGCSISVAADSKGSDSFSAKHLITGSLELISK